MLQTQSPQQTQTALNHVNSKESTDETHKNAVKLLKQTSDSDVAGGFCQQHIMNHKDKIRQFLLEHHICTHGANLRG